MSIQRIPTGIPRLDDLTEGGFPSDSMTLLVGHPGAGKTVFSGQFIYNGAAKYGARGVYVSFSEAKDTFLRNMLRFGWDFDRLERERRIAILDLAVTKEAGLQTNLNAVMESIASLNASRLVIDPFSAISMALKEPIDIRVMVHLLYKFLKKANCVSILVLDQAWGSPLIGHGISEFLTDGIIHLGTYFDENNRLRRCLRILKMRGTNHAKNSQEYDITDDGFAISEKQSTANTGNVRKIRRVKKSGKEPYFSLEGKQEATDF